MAIYFSYADNGKDFYRVVCPYYKWNSWLVLSFWTLGWTISYGHANKCNKKVTKKNRKQRRFFRNGTLACKSSLDCAHVNKSIMHVTTQERTAPIYNLSRSKAPKPQQLAGCKHKRKTSGLFLWYLLHAGLNNKFTSLIYIMLKCNEREAPINILSHSKAPNKHSKLSLDNIKENPVTSFCCHQRGWYIGTRKNFAYLSSFQKFRCWITPCTNAFSMLDLSYP